METRALRGTEEQGVTFVELFFDLVFVFAVTQITSVLAHDLTGGGVVRGLIVFWLVWWAWTQYTWSLNEADTEHPGIRLTTLAATAIAFMMAVSLPEVAGDTGWVFPLAYLVLRMVGIGLQWMLAGEDAEWAMAVRRWTIVSGVALVAVAVAIFVPPTYRFAALAVAALLDVFAALRAAAQGEWRLFSGHFAERHGLFVIIALGESLVAAGLSASEQTLTTGLLGVTLIAVAATCGLWWTYFGWVKDAVEKVFAAQSPLDVGRFARDAYSFAHFPVAAGVVGFAIAVEETLAHPDEPMAPAVVAALVVGTGAFIGGAALALARSGIGVPWVRTLALGLLVVAIPLFLNAPARISLGLTAVVAIGLAVTERPRSKPADLTA